MYDTITLDQLRAFITVVEEGSFSAAGRKLQRVQSAISTAMSNLEESLGVQLWSRATKIPTLTEQGKSVLIAARRVCSEVDSLRRLSASLNEGLESSVSLCVDVLFPVSALVTLCQGFAKKFPSVDLRVDTQVMSAVTARVLSGAATLGVVSPLGAHPNLERQTLSPIRMMPVVAAKHPLAQYKGAISTRHLSEYVQIVLSERQEEEGVPDQAVLSSRTWRIADLHTKHAMLRAGLGWGNLPEHLIKEDLRQRRLVRIRPQAWGEEEHTLFLSAIYLPSVVLGPAHRWVLASLKELCA